MSKKFYRTKYNAQVAGVCNGLAEYFNWDVSMVRLVFILAVLFFGNGLLLYLILWVIFPVKYFPNDTM